MERLEDQAQSVGKVAYVVSQELAKISSLLPANKNRSMLVHSLVSASGLIKNNSKVVVVRPQKASQRDLAAYHSSDYLEYVLNPENSQKTNSEFGLEDDCPPFIGLPDYMLLVAGASITAVKALINGVADLAISWDGGRHHARKAQAAGFCYVADVILALLSLKRAPPIQIEELQPRRPRIMYIDIDLHFCDAVAEAFATRNPSKSSQILTFSIHHAAPGFFPTHPLAELTSTSPEDPYNLSIPLKAGASSATLKRMWAIVEAIKEVFQPDYTILQCGTDGLAGDPCAISNYSLEGMGYCVSRLVQPSWSGKKLLLGGGGYDSANTARAWTYFTSIALGRPLPLEFEIPDHEGFPLYAPSFLLDVPPGNMQDQNTDTYLTIVEKRYDDILETLKRRLE